MHNFLIILVGEEKTSTSGIKVAVKNAPHAAQKYCKYFSFRKRTAKRNINFEDATAI